MSIQKLVSFTRHKLFLVSFTVGIMKTKLITYRCKLFINTQPYRYSYYIKKLYIKKLYIDIRAYIEKLFIDIKTYIEKLLIDIRAYIEKLLIDMRAFISNNYFSI